MLQVQFSKQPLKWSNFQIGRNQAQHYKIIISQMKKLENCTMPNLTL
jgi:hypothetical protein